MVSSTDQSVACPDPAWQFVSAILKDWGFVDFPTDPLTAKIDQSAAITVKWRYICCAVLSVLIIPVNYQRTLGTLRYFSFFIVGTILFCILVLAAH
jgi:hypothetical protein